MKRVIKILGGGGVVLSLFFFWFWWQISPPSSSGEEKIFVIPRGEELVSISERLEREGLIKNRYCFLALVYGLGLKGKIQAGLFRLSPKMKASQIAQVLTQGRQDRWITIIEGLRKEEIAVLLEEAFPFSAEDFLAVSEEEEGYLFPDTYLFPLKSTPEKIVALMKSNFDRKTNHLWEEAAKRGLKKNEVVILASLVEREAKYLEDRRLVAGVLIKRWRNQWPLQVDATIQYAKANLICQEKKDRCQWWPPVRKEDLKINSPYNTYLFSGLPPAPICNPSLASLEAVVNWQDSDYWFYLSDREGKIHFARTFEEHQKNINRYLN